MCPVCTVAVAGGLGLSRFLGIDDSVTGVWVGGLILSLSFWFLNWTQRKGWLKKIDTRVTFSLTALSLYLMTFLPLQITNFIGHPANKIWGMDKLIFGTIVGSLGFLFGIYLDKKQREFHGKQFFQFQKVVFPVSALLLSSVTLYLLIK